MKFRQTAHTIFCFLLPGIAAGGLLASGTISDGNALPISGVIFAAFALAGAIAGRWLFRNENLLGFGLLCFMALPLFGIRAVFPAGAFAFGIFAVRPIRPGNRLFFQAGVLTGVVLILASGSGFAGSALAQHLFYLFLLPAAAALLTAKLPFRKTAMFFTLLIGIVLFCFPWYPPGKQPLLLPWGESAQFLKGEKTTIRLGSRIYRFPRDLDRNMPDLLTASLQPETENIRALVLEEAPSNAELHLREFPWIHQVEKRSFFTDLPQILREDQERYDLIFVQELPGSTQTARDILLTRIQNTLLMPEGVIAAPAAHTLHTKDMQTILLPGSGGRIRLWAKSPVLLADTFPKLEERLRARNVSLSENNFSGMLETLYELRPAELNREFPASTPLAKGMAKLQQTLQKFPWMFPAAVLLLVSICWFSRSPRYGENFAVFAHGTASMLLLQTLLPEAGKYQLLLPEIPLAALFGLIAIALPHRSEYGRKGMITAVVCTLLAGGFFLAGFPAEILVKNTTPLWLAGAMLLPPLFLLAPAMQSGCIHKGGEAARYLHFAGLLAGALLFFAAPPWAVLLTAVLLLTA